jgi:hypothetical protein
VGAYNWILIDARCPACNQRVVLRCQTQVASDYDGDASGRFHDREYRLGEALRWWPRGSEQYNRSRNRGVDTSHDEEACHASCADCGASLFVVIAFDETTPVRVIRVTKGD